MASKRIAFLVATFILTGCATPQKASLHEALSSRGEQGMPHKILLLPVDVRVHEISAGGVVEKVDEWTLTANANATKSLRKIAGSGKAFELKEPPDFTGEDKAVLEEHLALYVHVAGSADLARSSNFEVWRERAKKFDYTLGPGLSRIAEHADADAAIIIVGSDYVSSSGRKATMALGFLAAAFTGVAIVPAGGTAFISVGVVDLKSGDLLWFSTDRSANRDLRDDGQMQAVLEQLFASYPGMTPAKAARGAQ